MDCFRLQFYRNIHTKQCNPPSPYNATITNNTITNIYYNKYKAWKAFYVTSTYNGSITFDGNSVGSATASDAIVLVDATPTVYGLHKARSNTPLVFTNNSIGGITATGGLYGIFFDASNSTAGTAIIDGNTIGSASIPNSIKTGTPVIAATFTGIYGSTSAFSSCTNNTIANITSDYEGTSTSGNIKGILMTGTGTGDISGNTIYNLKNASTYTGTAANASIIGISDNLSGTDKTISRNLVYNLENTSGNANTAITGMHAGGGTATYSNNIVSLGLDVSGSPVTTGYNMYALFNNGRTNNFYFNTLNITGTGLSGETASTYAFYSTADVDNFRNNILINTRTGGTGGQHYSLRIPFIPATLDYNDYYVAGGTGFLVVLNTTSYSDLAGWQSATKKEANSLNLDPAFTSATNLLPTNVGLVAGLYMAGITTDYAGTSRANPPTIGALEVSTCSNPAAGGTIETNQSGCSPLDPVEITSTAAATGFLGTLEYKWQASVTGSTDGFTDLEASNSETYDPGILTQTTWFKRLARVGCKSDWAGAAESNAVEITVTPAPEVISDNTATICSGASPAITLEATVNSTFSWAVGNITGDITGATGSSGALIDQALTNNGSAAGSVEYIITPTSVAGNCVGPDYTITVIVEPAIPVSVLINPFPKSRLHRFRG
jgi:hypothetical protein